MQKCGNMRKIGTCHESVFRFLIWPPEVPFLVPFGTPKMRKKLFFVFWKFNWSNGVRENEMIIIWCISSTLNVKTWQKFNEIAEMTKSWKVPGLLHCASYHISNGNSRVSHTPPPRISLEISGKFENAQIKRGKRIPGGIGGKMVSSMTRLQVEGRC